ncbi:MAG: DUF6660 family protein [Pyrinomonadaceae bacterium]
MRILTYIFVAYLLVLSVQPCTDSLLPLDNQGHETQKVSHLDPTSQDSDDNSNDNCSPFCVCSCCGSNPAPTIVYAFPVTTPISREASGEVFSQYKTPYESTRSFSIWQPPRA